ncbi:spore coat U domain-containing protein [Rhizobium herbae]|uniref:Spore coat U domain-containing protein n=1 Tax=Rhizobium herbae TaxID=508661 RepID=A0ABS7HCF4_9HYPH|nr:spore coat U domain-containing protein [Rhizobium herbae]MBW9064460.1 spore coat U domain-containing protein [Rhizobium herbae]
MKRFPAILAFCGVAALPPSVLAATSSASFNVQITITSACSLSASDLVFPTTGLLASDVAGSTSLGVTCTNTTPYSIGIDKGVNGASVTSREMIGGPSSELVSYQLCQDSACATNWGNTIGSDTVSGTGTGAAQSVTVYGLVPAQTTPAPGVYTDTVQVQLTY